MANPTMQGQETEYKPWGMLAGGMVGSREADQEAANLLALQDSQLGNVIRGVEAGRVSSDFTDPRMEALRKAGIMGKDQSSSAKGQLDMGTLQSNIGATNAGNVAKQSGSEIENITNAMDRSLAILDANGPAGLSMILPHMPKELQQIAEQYPQQFPQILKSMSEQLKQQRMNSPTHLGAMQLEDRKSENQEIIHGGDRDSREKVAGWEIAGRSADRAAQREATQASKDQSDGMRKEQELTRRMEHGRQKLKLLQDEYNQIDEALVTPVYGMTKEEKAARKTRLEKQKQEIQSSAKTLVTELDRLSSLSTFASKAGEGTAAKPIKLD